MALNRRAFVDKLPFITSFGHGRGGDHRRRLGLTTAGPTRVMTDMCVLEPEPESKELIVTALYEDVTRDDITRECGWPVRFAATLLTLPAPTADELHVLRDLQERTRIAHGAVAA